MISFLIALLSGVGLYLFTNSVICGFGTFFIIWLICRVIAWVFSNSNGSGGDFDFFPDIGGADFDFD